MIIIRRHTLGFTLLHLEHHHPHHTPHRAHTYGLNDRHDTFGNHASHHLTIPFRSINYPSSQALHRRLFLHSPMCLIDSDYMGPTESVPVRQVGG